MQKETKMYVMQFGDNPGEPVKVELILRQRSLNSTQEPNAKPVLESAVLANEEYDLDQDFGAAESGN
jgi:hypothetical protein